MTTPYPDYLGLLISGQVGDLMARLSERPMIDDVSGRFAGRDAVRGFLIEKSATLRDSHAQAERLRLTATDWRACDEQVLHFEMNGKTIDLPYAIVMERQADGKLSPIRIYHSQWPMVGSHVVRPAILQADPSIHLRDVIAQYQQALAAGDVDAVMATYEADAYTREPAGPQYTHRGEKERRALYSSLFAYGKGGGIPLEHCTTTDDGVACALEYNVVMLGGIPLTPQAGVAVYERGATGKLHAARIYDDIAVEG